MVDSISVLVNKKIKESRILRDAFWSVFGGGFGNFLLLLGGILIARFLGRDLYGEYGMVKTTMFYFASFATLGLGFSTTKYIADFINNNPNDIRSIVKSSLKITLCSSLTLCFLLFVFSEPIADFINEPQLKTAFRYLGVIIVFRSFTTTGIGLLSGFKKFKEISVASIISGFVLLILGAFLTYLWGIRGSLIALLFSQMTNSFIALYYVLYEARKYVVTERSYVYELLTFSFPITLQELSYAVCTWGTMLILTKYSSLGEVGLWSVSAQWNSIILLIPGLLANLVLSYLSGVSSNENMHKIMIKKLLLANLVSSFIPLVVVFFLSTLIASFYGPSFIDLPKVLNVLMLSTVFISIANVFQANLISVGKNWQLFLFRLIRDGIIIIALYIVLKISNIDAAYKLSIIYVLSYFIYFLLMALYYVSYCQNEKV